MAEPKPKVLIFEDNADIQTILKFYFMKRGMEPVLTDSGVDAVELVKANSPKLVIMDVIMPGADGIEACRNIREAGFKVPIVMLTSKAFNDDRERGLASGANVYLLKPFNPTELDAAIRPLLA